jgi:UDP-N-acetylmuramyl tripeptide synthase
MYFGVDDPDAVREEPDHASDFRVCLDCGSALSYATTYYGHVGHWRCPKCGNARPVPHVRLTSIEERDERLLLEAALPEGCLHLELPLAGLYNAYNALAAIAGALAIGLPRDAIVRALEGFTAAFGRQERFDVEGRDVRVLLGKNPTGLNQVLRTVAAAQGERRLLFVLNDGIADGRDVSWIWDADYELARPGCVWVMAAGTRAEDLALRLKYAGYGDDPLLERDAAIAVRRAIAATPAGATLHIIPTYTAMLEVRELLAKHAGVRSFWEDA